ncbi:MAG TPA: hypothetical protein EYN66_24425 [Myxococcales bacterium]|nr:hypothetical protein [Myxococcales bacterium]
MGQNTHNRYKEAGCWDKAHPNHRSSGRRPSRQKRSGQGLPLVQKLSVAQRNIGTPGIERGGHWTYSRTIGPGVQTRPTSKHGRTQQGNNYLPQSAHYGASQMANRTHFTRWVPMNTLWTQIVRAFRFLGRIAFGILNALYKLISRTALYALTLYLVAYFAINSNTFREELMNTLTDTMPGYFDCKAIHYGPLPWQITLLDVEILDPEGGPTIGIERLQSSIDLLAIWGWGLRKIVRGDQVPLELVFKKLRIHGADIVIEVRKNGWIGIARTFTDGTKKPSKGPPPLITLNDITIEGSRVKIAVENGGVLVNSEELNIIDAQVVIQNGRVRVDVGRLLSRRGQFKLGGLGPYGGPMQIPWSNFVTEKVKWNDGLLEIDRATLMASKSSLDYRGTIDTRGKSAGFDFHSSIEFDRNDPVILSYLHGVAQLQGKITAHLGGHSDALEIEATIDANEVTVMGSNIGSFSLGLSLSPEELRHAIAGELIELKPFTIAALDGAIHVNRARFWPKGVNGRKQSAELHVRFEDVNPATLWQSGLLGEENEAPEFLDGRLNGTLKSIAQQDQVDEKARWTIENQVDLMVNWPGHSDIALGPVYGVFGDLSLSLDEVESQTSFRHLYAFSGNDNVQLSGNMGLPTGPIDVHLNADIDLGPLLSTFGVESISGTAKLHDAQVTGSVLSPELNAQLELLQARVFAARISRLSANLKIADGELKIGKLNVASDMGKVTANAALQLWEKDLSSISKTLPLKIWGLSLRNFKLKKLGIKGLEGNVSLSAREFKANLGDQNLALKGRARLQVGNLRIQGEHFTRINAEVSANGQRFHLRSFNARLGNGAQIKASGHYNNTNRSMSLKAKIGAMLLHESPFLKRQKLPLHGRVDLELQAQGPVTNPYYSGHLNMRGFAFDSIQLGSANIQFERKKGTRVVTLASSSFFQKMTLEKGYLKLDRKGIPERLFVSAQSKNTNVLRVLPALRGSLHKLNVGAGDILFDLDFSGKSPMKLIFDFPHHSLQAQLVDETPIITNNGPLWANLVGGVAAIERYVLEWSGQRLVACGTIDLSGPINLDIAGAVNIGQLNLRQYVNDLSGRLITHNKQGSTNAPFDDSCLLMTSDKETLAAIGNPSGYLKLRHRLDAPSLNGSFLFQDMRMSLRDLNQEITIGSGLINFESSEDGSNFKISIPKKNALSGTFGDGSIELHGDISLPNVASRSKAADWMPDSINLKVQGTSISWSAPKEYRVTFHPDLELKMSGLHNKSLDNPPVLKLTGKVEVTDGDYNKSFNRFAQALGSIVGRSVDAYSASLTDTIPELNNLALDLNVSGSNFRVDSEFGVGSANLESSFKVRVQGTLGAPDVNGRVEVNEGTIVYKLFGREFDIQRGSLDFDGNPEHPILDIEAVADFDYQTRSRFRQTAEEESLAVTIKLTGRLPDINVALTSNDASLSQVDLQYLILIGVTKSDFEEGGVGDKSTLDIVGANVTNLVTKVLQAPFLEKVTITPTAGGGSEFNIITRLGRAVRFGITSTQEGSESSYNVLFRYKISDRLSLEGTLRPPAEDEDGRQKYNAKLKYSIPLD